MTQFVGASAGHINVGNRNYLLPPGPVGDVGVRNGRLMVNGQPFAGISDLDIRLASKIEIHIHGGAEQVKTDAAEVHVHGPCGGVETVGGNVSTDGSITGVVSTVSGTITAKEFIKGPTTGTKKKRKREEKKREEKKTERRPRAAPKRKRQRREATNGPAVMGVFQDLFSGLLDPFGPIFSEAATGAEGKHQASGVTTSVTDGMAGDCAICLEPLKNKPEVRILDCLHKFCEPCIQGWEREKEVPTCPTCRQ